MVRGSEQDAGHILVAIPTHRRPNGLRKLLESLFADESRRRFAIVVAENDEERQEGRRVCEAMIAQGTPVELQVVPSARRGISEARNALMEYALADPDCAYLLMLDDDEWIAPGWLDAMVDALEHTGSDIVGGPVKRIMGGEMPAYLREANTVRSKSDRLERIRSIEATSNIGFDMRFLRRFPDERFDPFFSLIGGGDYDFLLRMRLKRATFVWSPDAVVYEDFPASRCTREWALQRAFRSGSSETLVALRNRPPQFRLKEAAKLVRGLVQVAYHGSLAISARHRFAAQRALARTRGKISALIGRHHRDREYDVIHGS